MEDFGSVTSGRDCMLAPSIMPIFDRSVQNYTKGLMTLENYCALAHSLYQQGADGLNVYNFQYHWFHNGYPGSADAYPSVFSYFRQLREPSDVAQHDRQYLFYPMWHGPYLSFDKNYQLNIPSKVGSSGIFRFRAFEVKASANANMTMRFAAISIE